MFKSFWIGSIVLGLLSATVVGEDDASKGPRIHVGTPGVKVDVQSGNAWEKALGVTREKARAARDTIKLGEYWLGVECRPVRGALSVQLGLPEDQGLVVEAVVSDGPAAKAGIQRHDVLMTADGKPLKGVPDLIKAIETAKDKELSLELIRGGKRKKIVVTPAKRPAQSQPGDSFPVPGPDDFNKLHEWIERIQSDAVGRGPIRFRFMHPGAILPPGANVRPPLPDNMTVIITKEGAKPAEVMVRQNGKTWNITEKELDKLPEGVRKHVEQMLGGMSKPWVRMAAPILKEPAAAPSDSFEKLLERRFDEMNRRIEQIHELLEQMQM